MQQLIMRDAATHDASAWHDCHVQFHGKTPAIIVQCDAMHAVMLLAEVASRRTVIKRHMYIYKSPKQQLATHQYTLTCRSADHIDGTAVE